MGRRAAGGSPSKSRARVAARCSTPGALPMRGISISRLLMVAVFVPLAGLALFGGRLSYDSWSRYSDLSRASSVLRLAVATSRFAGLAVPAEGAATRGVIGGTGDRARMEAARKVTDEYYAQVRAAADAL